MTALWSFLAVSRAASDTVQPRLFGAARVRGNALVTNSEAVAVPA